VQNTVCDARKYRFTAPNLTAATAGNGAATGWNWMFTGALGASATIDSGTSSSRVIVVTFSSNAAAVVGDSVKVRYTSNCAFSRWKASKLMNKVLLKPAAPSSITITALSTNVCGNRVYRFSAPALPAAVYTELATITAATGYLWSFVGSFGSNAVIDSGTINSRKIRVVFTSNDAAGIGDSVRLAYLSSCGTTANKSIKLPIPAKTGCPSSLKPDMKTTDLDKSLHMQISPNPSSDKFKLQITGATADSKATAVIMDIQGRIVKTYSFNSNTSLDFGNDLMPGIYIIRVATGKEERVMKIVKQ